jgi:RNA polymerase sigma-70 factor (ECF subfamily)
MNEQEPDFVRLLRNAQEGDRQSLQALCTGLQQIMRPYFTRKFRDPDIVDDLSQETQLRLLKSIPAIKAPVSLKNFVLKVAFHVTQDYFRQKYRRNEYPFSSTWVSSHQIRGSQGMPATQNNDSDFVISKLDIERAMEKLPEKTRRILQMKAEGYKYEEIGKMLAISVSAVKMQIKRGMEKLKNSIYNVTFLILGSIIVLVL